MVPEHLTPLLGSELILQFRSGNITSRLIEGGPNSQRNTMATPIFDLLTTKSLLASSSPASSSLSFTIMGGDHNNNNNNNNETAITPTTTGKYIETLNEYYQLSVAEQTFFSILFALTIFTSVIGNFLVIWIIFKTRRTRLSNTNYFIVNLALVDLFIMIFNVPWTFIYVINGNVWPWGTIWCKMVWSIGTVALSANGFTFAAIMVDRWVLFQLDFFSPCYLFLFHLYYYQVPSHCSSFA